VTRIVALYRVDSARRIHILDGDAEGGGHRFGTGKRKSEFPQTWSDDQIIGAIEDVANDPASSHSPSRGSIKVTGNRNGVVIIVIVDPATADIITGYPAKRSGQKGASNA
jgi:hypothetical protein